MQNYNHKVGKKFSVHKIIHPKAARRSSNGTLKRCFSSLVHSKQLSVHNKVNNLPFFPTFNSRRRFYTSEVQPKKDGVMVRKYFFLKPTTLVFLWSMHDSIPIIFFSNGIFLVTWDSKFTKIVPTFGWAGYSVVLKNRGLAKGNMWHHIQNTVVSPYWNFSIDHIPI